MGICAILLYRGLSDAGFLWLIFRIYVIISHIPKFHDEKGVSICFVVESFVASTAIPIHRFLCLRPFSEYASNSACCYIMKFLNILVVV